MKLITNLLLISTILVVPDSSRAEMLNVEPISHFAIAAGATYIIDDLCEKHVKENKYCLPIAILLVASYATWERNNLPDFEQRSYYMDLAGIGFTWIILRW